jgi:hypothetical protein
MVKYVGTEGAGDLASGEGLKMVLFRHFSQCFWVTQPARIFSKNVNVDF